MKNSILIFLLFTTGVSFAQTINNNDKLWYDIEGKMISAHSGDIIQAGDYYYWYGETYKNNPEGIVGIRTYSGFRSENFNGIYQQKPNDHSLEKSFFDGFTVYRSKDLATWENLGFALKKPEWGLLHNLTAHRAHVLYNDSTKKYVMYFYYYIMHPNNLLMVATADQPEGPFVIQGIRETGSPIGSANDLNVFKDDDGKAYVIYDDGYFNIRIDELTSDYLSSKKNGHLVMNYRQEAPAMIKIQNKYLVVASGVNGWNPTDTRYAIADKPLGKYSEKKLLSPEGLNSWGGQTTDIFYHKESSQYIVMFDRWWSNGGDLDKSGYMWLPLIINSNGEFMIEKVEKINLKK